MISRRQLALSTGLVVSGLVQARPLEPTTWVVPFSAGSAQDTIARLLANRWAASAGVPLVVQNKAGAAGSIAAAHVAKSPADGRTLLFAASSHHLSAGLIPQLTYHPLHSFRTAAGLGFSEFVLVTTARMKVANLSDFVKRVAAVPGGLNYASSGNGSATHVVMASFLARAQLEMVHIPFKSTVESVQELLAGRVHAAILPAVTAHGLQSDPRLHLLAMTSSERSVHLPGYLTLSESGYPGFEWKSWAALLAPVGVPDSTIQAIHNSMARFLADPQVKRDLQLVGVASSPLSPEQFDQFLSQDWFRSQELTRRLKAPSD